jgi:hypothetical protein
MLAFQGGYTVEGLNKVGEDPRTIGGRLWKTQTSIRLIGRMVELGTLCGIKQNLKRTHALFLHYIRAGGIRHRSRYMPWHKRNRLTLVPERQASGRALEIYQEIKAALGVPHINVLFQAFGAHPEFLERQWQALGPVVKDPEFFAGAERLRADAYTRIYNYFQVPDLCERVEIMNFSEGARDELTETTELFHYEDSLLLLFIGVQMHAFEGPTATTSRVETEAVTHPVFTTKPLVVEEDDAPAPIRKLYDDIRRTLELPFVHSEYRAFARWPDFLRAYWSTVKPIVQSPLYHESQSGIREAAWSLGRSFPARGLSLEELSDAGLEEDEIASLVRLTEMFLKAFSGLVLNVAVAKIALEGGSKKPAAHPPKPPAQEVPREAA